jgi:hypothetical protein
LVKSSEVPAFVQATCFPEKVELLSHDKGIRMRKIVALFIVVIVVSCGYNPEETMYDTKANPAGFPPQALRLITLVESDSLRTVERANIEFGELYVDHPKLLDNSDWRAVIGRMGARFTLRAQEAIESGIGGFEQASQYYTLAAFARPQDKAAQRMAQLLEPWLRAKQSEQLNTNLTSPPRNSQQLHQQLEDLRYFLFRDSLSHQFARDLLVPRVKSLILRSEDLMRNMQTNLSLADRSLLAYMDLVEVPNHEEVVFAEPDVELVAHRLVDIGDSGHRLELYFVPRTATTVDYTVAVRAQLPSDPESTSPDSPRRATFDFSPLPPTSQWQPGETIAIGHVLPVAEVADSLYFGLYQHLKGGSQWGQLANTQDTLTLLLRTGQHR